MPPVNLSKLRGEISRFIISGCLNFVLTTAVFVITLKLFRLHYLLCVTLTWTVGILFVFMVNRMWVFKVKPKNKLAIFLKLLAVYLFSYFVNMVLLDLLAKNTDIDAIYLQFSLIPIFVSINFVGSKILAFKS